MGTHETVSSSESEHGSLLVAIEYMDGVTLSVAVGFSPGGKVDPLDERFGLSEGDWVAWRSKVRILYMFNTGTPYLDDAASASRAALRSHTSACWVLSCFRNPPNSDMDHMIFNVRT